MSRTMPLEVYGLLHAITRAPSQTGGRVVRVRVSKEPLTPPLSAEAGRRQAASARVTAPRYPPW